MKKLVFKIITWLLNQYGGQLFYDDIWIVRMSKDYKEWVYKEGWAMYIEYCGKK